MEEENANYKEQVINNYKNEHTIESFEDACAIIGYLEQKIEMLEHNVDSAYEKARNIESKLKSKETYILTELNTLSEQARVHYRANMLAINNIKGGILND